MRKTKIAIIGAGIMGLACAQKLLNQNFEVHVYEKEARVGGMAASFDFDGTNIEIFYHFICGPDKALFRLLEELNLIHLLKWNRTKMGFYYQGEIFKWSSPLHLMAFPKASMLSKVRYGFHIFWASRKTKWGKLDRIKAIDWIKGNVGENSFGIFWKPLFTFKFYEFAKSISAAWIWSRIRRVALSRKKNLVEYMGYLEGGLKTLFDALIDDINKKGGQIYLNNEVTKINFDDKGKLEGLQINGTNKSYDIVLSTIPLPYIPNLIPNFEGSTYYQKIKSVNNIGVVCVVLKLKQRFSDNFWLNINDPEIQIPGIIEYSNLNPIKEHVLYIPFYLHHNHPKYQQNDQLFYEEVFHYLSKINSRFNVDWVIAKKVHKYMFAQPICTPGFLNFLPPIAKEVEGLYVVDTSYYYPEDRSISESIRLGQKIAGEITIA